MPTPVGPAPRDPKDPDLWDEWYDGVGDELTEHRFGWPIRLVAILILVGVVVVFVLAG